MLSVLFPTYFELLTDDIVKYGEETYRDLKESAKLLKRPYSRKPKLVIDCPIHGVHMTFSLMQIAAAHHDIDDEHVTFWYDWKIRSESNDRCRKKY